MAARFAIWLAAILLLPSLSLTAHAYPGSPFRYCRAETAAGPIARTYRPDGRFIFQSTLSGLVPAKDRQFRAYLVWLGSPSARPHLWVFQRREQRTKQRLFAGARDDMSTAPLGTYFYKNGVEGFDVDPQELIGRFADGSSARLILEREDGRGRTAATSIDLASLRAQLAAAAQPLKFGDCSDDYDAVPDEINAATYVVCTIEQKDASGEYQQSFNDAPEWTFTLAPQFTMSAGGFFTDFRDSPTADLSRLSDPGGPLAKVRFGGPWKGFPKGATVTLMVDGITRPNLIDMNYRAEWQVLEQLNRDSALTATLRDRQGRELARGALPAGTLAVARATIVNVIERRREMLENPMVNCAPNGIPRGFYQRSLVIS